VTDTDDRYVAAGLRPPQATIKTDPEIVAPLIDAPPSEPYEGVTVPELKADLDRRNATRDEGHLIVVDAPGNRPELVAALVADDNAPTILADAAGDASDNPTQEVSA